MTPAQNNSFREALTNEVAEYNRLLENRDGIQIEQSPEYIARRNGSLNREIAAQILSSHHQHLRDAQDALARLDDGTFGLCIDCDEPISHSRLRALPSAKRCTSCQEREEDSEMLQGKMKDACLYGYLKSQGAFDDGFLRAAR